jgi:hypothetical protein
MYGTLPLASAGFSAFAGSSYATAVTQSASTDDTLGTSGVLNAFTADSGSVLDVTLAAAAQQFFVTDGAGATVAATSSVVLPSFIQELLSAQPAAPLAFPKYPTSVVELLEGSSAGTAAAGFAASFTSYSRARVFNVGLRRWEQIDDAQQSNWTDILIARTIDTVATLGGDNIGVTPYAGALATVLPVNDAKWLLVPTLSDGQWGDVLVATFVDDIGTYAGASFGSLSYAGQVQAFIPDSVVLWVDEAAETTPQWQDVL